MTLTTRAADLLAHVKRSGETGRQVAGLQERKVVAELLRAGLVRVEREPPPGYKARVYTL